MFRIGFPTVLAGCRAAATGRHSSPSLPKIQINTSKKFSPKKDFFELRNLKVLCLNACGPLDNLRFLKQMPNLLDFRFVDTKIVDGDLTAI